MKIYLLIAIGSLLISCVRMKEPASGITIGFTVSAADRLYQKEGIERVVKNDLKPERNIKTIAQIGEMKDGDPIKIEGVRCEGNTLLITVSYGGGCGEHSFEVNGSRAVMKSMPQKRSVKLTHTNHQDYCKAIVTKTIEVDISELSQVQIKGSRVLLLLSGWNEAIEYIYE